MTARRAAIRAVILDVDGTLLDSNRAHAQAWVDALDEAGYPITLDRMMRRIGKGGDHLLPELTGLDDEDPRAQRISARRGAIFDQRYFPALRPFPRVRELLEHMRTVGLRLAVGTSASAADLDRLLDKAGVADLIEHKTCASDVERSKPDPDIVQATLAALALPASKVMMLGDTPYDIESAQRAGVATIAVRSGGWSPEELAGAVAIYADVAALLAGFAESPLA